MGKIGGTTYGVRILTLLLAAFAGLAQNQAKALAYDYDLAASDGGWTASPTSNPASWTWSVGTGWSTPGGTNADTTVASPSISFSDSTWRLAGSFTHYFNFELGYDYGYLQFSVNGGTWTTVPNALLTGFAYNNGAHTVFTGAQGSAGSLLTTNFILGSGSSATYFNPGDQVQVRFTGHWDEAYTPAGPDWTVTSVSLTVIPEPASWGMAMGCGLAGLAFSRRRFIRR